MNHRPRMRNAALKLFASLQRVLCEEKLFCAWGLVFLVGMCSVLTSAHGQTPWSPSSGQVQFPIWPTTPPNQGNSVAKEETQSTGTSSLVAGKPWIAVKHVSVPTLTVYRPRGSSSGAAVVVFPGGGYEILAIDLEGTEVCNWLTSRGIVCILLKYRVPAPRSAPYWGAYPQSAMALQDAQRTLSLVRFHAEEWHIDPGKIGVLGFSAGGHLAAAVSVHYGQRLYSHVDAADETSCRPAFAIALYPGHLAVKPGTLSLTPDIAKRITKDTPPTFLLQNEDDAVDSVWNVLSYYAALKTKGVPVELHSYAHGGHAFGLRWTAEASTEWPRLVERWLTGLQVLPPRSAFAQ